MGFCKSGHIFWFSDGLSRLTILSCKVNNLQEVPGKREVALCVCEYSKLIIKAGNDSQLDIRVLCKQINNHPSCNF